MARRAAPEAASGREARVGPEDAQPSQYQLAKDISVPPHRINEIIRGKRAVTADTALRLSRYELEVEKDRLRGRLTKEVRVLTGAG